MYYEGSELQIEINENTIDSIVEELLSQSERPIEALVKESEDNLKIVAIKFLSVINYEKNNTAQLEKVLQAKKDWEVSWKKENQSKYRNANDVKSALRSSKVYQNYNNQINAIKKSSYLQESVKNIYKAGMAFQDIMNKSINQQPILTYVTSNKNNVGIYKVPLREAFAKKLLKVDISSDGNITMRFGGGYKTLEKYANSVDSEIKVLQSQRGIDDKPILDATYKEVMNRFNKFKLEVPKNKVVSVVLWKHGGDWMKMLPSAKGDINEAYANYYIRGLVDSKDSTAKDLSSKGSMDENIHSFMTLVAEVDNARGRLLGDVSVATNGGSLDYAIKSAGASVLSMGSLIEMAEEVINASNGSVRETLKAMRNSDESKKVYRNFATKVSKEDVVYEVEKTVKTRMDPFSKNFNLTS